MTRKKAPPKEGLTSYGICAPAGLEPAALRLEESASLCPAQGSDLRSDGGIQSANPIRLRVFTGRLHSARRRVRVHPRAAGAQRALRRRSPGRRGPHPVAAPRPDAPPYDIERGTQLRMAVDIDLPPPAHRLSQPQPQPDTVPDIQQPVRTAYGAGGGTPFREAAPSAGSPERNEPRLSHSWAESWRNTCGAEGPAPYADRDACEALVEEDSSIRVFEEIAQETSENCLQTDNRLPLSRPWFPHAQEVTRGAA